MSDTATYIIELVVGVICVWLGWFTAQRRGFGRLIGVLIAIAGVAAVVHAAVLLV